MWCVYILRCSDESLYTGITTDISRRLIQHTAGKGSKSLLGKRPVSLVYLEKSENRSLASKREYEIKQLSREEKLALVTSIRAPEVA